MDWSVLDQNTFDQNPTQNYFLLKNIWTNHNYSKPPIMVYDPDPNSQVPPLAKSFRYQYPRNSGSDGQQKQQQCMQKQSGINGGGGGSGVFSPYNWVRFSQICQIILIISNSNSRQSFPMQIFLNQLSSTLLYCRIEAGWVASYFHQNWMNKF